MTKKSLKKYFSMNKLVKFCLSKNTSLNLKSISRNNFGMPLVNLWQRNTNKKIINKDKKMIIIEVIVEEEDIIKRVMEIEIIEIEEIIEKIAIIETTIAITRKKAIMIKKENIKTKDRTIKTAIIVD
jgi:fructose-1,6-bisphosphatase